MLLEVTNDGSGGGGKERVEGQGEDVGLVHVGRGQEVLQEPVGFTIASVPQIRGQSLLLLTSVASVSLAGEWVHLVSPTSWFVGIDKW